MADILNNLLSMFGGGRNGNGEGGGSGNLLSMVGNFLNNGGANLVTSLLGGMNQNQGAASGNNPLGALSSLFGNGNGGGGSNPNIMNILSQLGNLNLGNMNNAVPASAPWPDNSQSGGDFSDQAEAFADNSEPAYSANPGQADSGAPPEGNYTNNNNGNNSGPNPMMMNLLSSLGGSLGGLFGNNTAKKAPPAANAQVDLNSPCRGCPHPCRYAQRNLPTFAEVEQMALNWQRY
ncbi:MAG: hypothetical protein FWF85_05345 [Clostridiales bacterium]|nr:hypothetical protein [Clostridiales bacterium]MDR2711562.1 hypothetical protein [Clostridiales bacterium]